ncbi:bacterial regulatory helix-turn-helix, lysR family protein, partial [Vibrio parahaemolyticus V-223/04]
QERSRPTVGKE